MKKQTVSCKIEHHAVLFALLAKYAIQECGDEGREAILAGMTAYGNEHPISPEESKELAKKKKELGTSCMKDFNFHTAHLKYTISRFLVNYLGEDGQKAVSLALQEYTEKFGKEYLDALDGVYP